MGTIHIVDLCHCAAWRTRIRNSGDQVKRESDFTLVVRYPWDIFRKLCSLGMNRCFFFPHHKKLNIEISYISTYAILNFPLKGTSGHT